MADLAKPFLAELEWRGLLHQTAGPGIEEHLAGMPRVGYCGFDPTADSLGVGNLVARSIMRQQKHGNCDVTDCEAKFRRCPSHE